MGHPPNTTAATVQLMLGYVLTYNEVPDSGPGAGITALQGALNAGNELRQQGSTFLRQGNPAALEALCKLTLESMQLAMQLWLVAMMRRIEPILTGSFTPDEKISQITEIVEGELTTIGVELETFRRGRGIGLRVELARVISGQLP